jgi:hypothetical protein
MRNFRGKGFKRRKGRSNGRKRGRTYQARIESTVQPVAQIAFKIPLGKWFKLRNGTVVFRRVQDFTGLMVRGESYSGEKISIKPNTQVVICTEENYRGQKKQELPKVKVAQVLYEPVGSRMERATKMAEKFRQANRQSNTSGSLRSPVASVAGAPDETLTQVTCRAGEIKIGYHFQQMNDETLLMRISVPVGIYVCGRDPNGKYIWMGRNTIVRPYRKQKRKFDLQIALEKAKRTMERLRPK